MYISQEKSFDGFATYAKRSLLSAFIHKIFWRRIMFQFVCKKIPPWRPAFSLSRNQDLCFLQFHHFSTSSKSILKSNKSKEDKRLFIINYLTKTCGLPQKSAESFSKYLNFETRQKPDSVISFFKNQGFTSNQISWLIRRFPLIFDMNPDKNVLPKLQFFRSVGLSTEDIAVMISRASSVLRRSLEKQIIPVFRYLSSLLQSQENALVCIKRYGMIMGHNLENVLMRNVGYLGEVGVPRKNVVTFVSSYPLAITFKPDRFRKAVDGVKSMGLDPLRSYFVTAVYAFCMNRECMWKKKVEIYKCYGFSDADVFEAFQRYPFCMANSSDKIRKVMDCLVNKMGFEPSLVVKRPHFVSYSMEKRIVPRCSVYQALLAKDLVPKKFTLRLLLESQEKKFLCTFVESFEAQVPGLLMMYKNSVPVST